MSGGPSAPEAGPAPTPEKKADLKSTFKSSLADSLGLTVTAKPTAKPVAPAKPEPKAAGPSKTGMSVQDAMPAAIAPSSVVRGIEPDLPKASPRTQTIEGAGLRAKQGIDMPRLPVSFRPREGWADVSGRNIGKESGFRNTRMAAREMEADHLRAWAEHNMKELEERKRGGPSG